MSHTSHTTLDSFPTVEELELGDYKAPLAKKLPRRRWKAFTPPFPLPILAAVVAAKAEMALPLILAIHRQLVMTKRASTPLNGAIWEAAGDPPTQRKKTILRRLQTLSEVISLTAEQTPMSYYRVAKGPLWELE